MPDAIAHATKSQSAHAGEVALMQRLIETQAATIADLRARLDREAEERRRLSERLTGLLTYRRPGRPGGGDGCANYRDPAEGRRRSSPSRSDRGPRQTGRRHRPLSPSGH